MQLTLMRIDYRVFPRDSMLIAATVAYRARVMGARGCLYSGTHANASALAKVKVLSAPQLLVMDNEPAHLQVGQQVPVLTGTATGTLASVHRWSTASIIIRPG
jgi:type II/III secretion system protein